MFNSKRYVTQGIASEIPLETQIFLWGLVDSLKVTGIELDYLQVFRLNESEHGRQSIAHSQEVPKYHKNHLIKPTITANCKIFIIDSGEYSTMLLAQEY